jgi:hypothetical protein
MIFDSADLYIETASTIRGKITKIDAIITALETTALKAAAKNNIEEYWLNDGQTQIKTKYRTTEDVLKSIKAFEQLKQMYVNKLNGRTIRLVDSKNFR